MHPRLSRSETASIFGFDFRVIYPIQVSADNRSWQSRVILSDCKLLRSLGMCDTGKRFGILKVPVSRSQRSFSLVVLLVTEHVNLAGSWHSWGLNTFCGLT